MCWAFFREVLGAALPGMLWACHICTVLFTQPTLPSSCFWGRSSILRRDSAPWSEKAMRVYFLPTEASFAVCRCTAAWSVSPSTRRGRLHRQPNVVWVKKKMIGWTALAAWRVETAAGWSGLLKCEFSRTASFGFYWQLRKIDLHQKFLRPVLGQECFTWRISTGEAWRVE